MYLLCIKGSNVCLYSASVCDSLSRQSATSINSLTITLHKPLTHSKHPLMKQETFSNVRIFTCQLRHTHKSHLLVMNISNLTWFCMNSGFCHKGDEKSTLLCYYVVSSGNSLAMFRENLKVSSAGDPCRWVG